MKRSYLTGFMALLAIVIVSAALVLVLLRPRTDRGAKDATMPA